MERSQAPECRSGACRDQRSAKMKPSMRQCRESERRLMFTVEYRAQVVKWNEGMALSWVMDINSQTKDPIARHRTRDFMY